MIVTLDDVKRHLRIDGDEDDHFLTSLISVAEEYVKNATGKDFDETNQMARIACLMLIADLYEHREATEPSDKVRFMVRSMLMQLSL